MEILRREIVGMEIIIMETSLMKINGVEIVELQPC